MLRFSIRAVLSGLLLATLLFLDNGLCGNPIHDESVGGDWPRGSLDSARVSENKKFIHGQPDRWVGFRGDGSGVTQASGLPTHWSPDSGIAWQVNIRGFGQSSPVIWNGRIFVTSIEGPNKEQCLVHAFDLQNGKRSWSREFSSSQPMKNFFRNSRAAPTSAVDEQGVYAFFGGGDLIALDHDGTLLWKQSLVAEYGEFKNGRGLASSIAQTDDCVMVLVDHESPSYLVAFDKSTGEQRWKTDRGIRTAAWSSPIVINRDGKDIVIVSSSGTVDAYDAVTGTLLWQQEGLGGNLISSAGMERDRIFVGAAGAVHLKTDEDVLAKSNCCLQLTGNAESSGYKMVWGAQRAKSYYSTPLAHRGYVYFVNKVGVLFCLDQETGRELYAKRIGGPCWASAIGAGDHVYLFLKKGGVLIIKSGPQYESVAENRLWGDREVILTPPAVASAAKQDDSTKIPVKRNPPNQKPSADNLGNTRPGRTQPPSAGEMPDFGNMDEKTLHRIFSYSESIIYGAAVVDGHLVVRTGQGLYCIKGNSSTTENQSP